MKVLNRDKCIITGNNDLELLYTFPNFPVFMGCVDTDEPADDICSEMSWWISKGSGSIQLNPVPDLDLIYPASHGSGTIGKTWEAHHTAFGDFILKFGGTNLLEIGGGHGFLANYFLDRKPAAFWTLVDPNPSAQPRDNLKIINGYFPVTTGDSYDVIVHSHLFEHIIEPIEFCQQLSRALDTEGYLIFSIPNLGEILERKYTNILNFEHSFFLNEYFAEYMLNIAGFEVLEKKMFLEDHSIFYAARKSAHLKKPVLANQYAKNIRLFNDYIDHHNILINYLNKAINDTEKAVFLFGGHAMSQFLIAFGLNTERVHSVIDNDPDKHGKRLNGTHLKVESPLVLEGKKEPIVILRAGAFQSEISTQLKLINPAVRIIPADDYLPVDTQPELLSIIPKN